MACFMTSVYFPYPVMSRGVPITEEVEGFAAKHAGIRELVLAEHVDGLVGNHGTGERGAVHDGYPICAWLYWHERRKS